jgi:hypothetical protein
MKLRSIDSEAGTTLYGGLINVGGYALRHDGLRRLTAGDGFCGHDVGFEERAVRLPCGTGGERQHAASPKTHVNSTAPSPKVAHATTVAPLRPRKSGEECVIYSFEVYLHDGEQPCGGLIAIKRRSMAPRSMAARAKPVEANNDVAFGASFVLRLRSG